MPNPAIDIFAFDETFFNDASFLESLHEINATLQTCPERLCSQGSGEDIKVAALLKAAQAHHQALNGNDIASYELRKQAHLYMRRAKRKLGEPPLVPEQFRDGKILPFKRRPLDYGIYAEATEWPSVRVDDPNHYEAWEPET